MKMVRDYPDYSIAKNGGVRSKRRATTKGGWLKPLMNGTGYQYVALSKNGIRVNHYIHRLVLDAYVGPCPEGMECRHLNSDRTDNHLGNLKWGTKSENHQDAIKRGTHSGLLKGERRSNSKLKESEIRMIVYMYRTSQFSQREIAEIYGVKRETVRDIITKRNWKHIWAGGSSMNYHILVDGERIASFGYDEDRDICLTALVAHWGGDSERVPIAEDDSLDLGEVA